MNLNMNSTIYVYCQNKTNNSPYFFNTINVVKSQIIGGEFSALGGIQNPSCGEVRVFCMMIRWKENREKGGKMEWKCMEARRGRKNEKGRGKEGDKKEKLGR